MSRSRLLLPMFLIVLASSCDDNTGPDGGLTPVQESQVGAVVQDEVETDLDALMIETGVTPSGAMVGPSIRGDGFANAVNPCVAPSNTTDADNDGIYTDATIIYTAPPCTWTHRRGGTMSLVGTLRITDPTPTAGLAFSNTLTGLTFTFTGATVSARNFSVSRTGTRSVLPSGAGFTAASNLTITRTFNTGTPATVQKIWASSFTPIAGASLVAGQPLPSGTFSISGSISWTRGDESFAMTVTTPTPLSYLASCASAQRFTAGELRADGRFDGRDGYLRIRWTACGTEPTVEFVAA